MITEKTKQEFEKVYRIYSNSICSMYTTANNLIKESMLGVDFIEVDGEPNGLFSSWVREFITGIENVDGVIYIKTAHECRSLQVLNVDEIAELARYIVESQNV